MVKKIRVLLVDDEERFVANLARILEVRRFEVSKAFDGAKAISLIKRGLVFDVVVLDIKMPGPSGLEVLKEIKNMAPETEVIMLTGHATISSGTNAMRDGAYDYLIKPCDIEDLVEKIREAHEVTSIRRKPVLWTRKTAGEIIAPDISALRPEDTLEDAVKAMSPEKNEDAPEEICVIDREGRLLGLVTKRTLVDEARKKRPQLDLNWDDLQYAPKLGPKKSLADVMLPAAITVTPDKPLSEVVRIMIEYNLRRLPVMDGDRVVGIIRMKDVLKHVEHELE